MKRGKQEVPGGDEVRAPARSHSSWPEKKMLLLEISLDVGVV